MNQERKIRPFSCGSEAADWIAENCDKCKKHFRHDQRRYHCRWQKEIDRAYLLDGKISEKCAIAIGINPITGGFQSGVCPGHIPLTAPPEYRRPGVDPGQLKLFNNKNGG